jgi:hypothetical protein
MKKKSIIAGAVLITAIVISGCSNKPEFSGSSSLSSRNDAFSESSHSEAESGKALVNFMFSVKSTSARIAEIYVKHSNPPYRVHLNIDGKSIILESEPVLEDKALIDPNMPESGTGWKYTFSKQMTLAPGKHTLTIALPIDKVLVEGKIVLQAGMNTISLNPLYNRKLLRPSKSQSFSAGVKTVEVAVNGIDVPVVNLNDSFGSRVVTKK